LNWVNTGERYWCHKYNILFFLHVATEAHAYTVWAKCIVSQILEQIVYVVTTEFESISKTFLHFANNVYLGSLVFTYNSTVISIDSLKPLDLETVPKPPRCEVLRGELMEMSFEMC
jgi:hypothetical protein